MKESNYALKVILVVFVVLLTRTEPYAEEARSTKQESYLPSVPAMEYPDDSSSCRALASRLLRLKKFDEIEVAVKYYISSKSRDPNGTWNLIHFFRGLTNVGSKSSIENFKQSESRLTEWIENSIKSKNAKIAKALMLNSYAWKARGGGYANTVSRKAWELFSVRLKEAYKLLEESRDSSNPMWYSAQQKLATGLSMPKVRYYALIREATSFHPDFDEIYTNATWYLLPRWFGEKGEWQSYRDEVVSEVVDDFRKDEIYFLMSRNALRYEGLNKFEEQDVDWQKFQNGCEFRDVHFPSKFSQVNLCLMACISKDQKSATRFFLREPESKPYKSSIWEKYTFKSVGEWRIWAFDGKSWSERKDELLSLAKNGIADSQYELGTALYYRNKTKYLKDAKSWLQKASDQGHRLAKLRLEVFKKESKTSPVPLIVAWDIAQGDMNAVKKKLQAGADPNAMVYAHISALHWACEKGQFEIAQMLLSHGAESNKLNGARLTPLDLVLQPNKKGLTPMQRMSKKTQTQLIKILKEKGGKTSKELANKVLKK